MYLLSSSETCACALTRCVVIATNPATKQQTTRLLGLPLGRQNLLFNYFAATLAAEVAAARAEGRYNEGVSDLQVSQRPGF
jgi:hypothetical protein